MLKVTVFSANHRAPPPPPAPPPRHSCTGASSLMPMHAWVWCFAVFLPWFSSSFTFPSFFQDSAFFDSLCHWQGPRLPVGDRRRERTEAIDQCHGAIPAYVHGWCKTAPTARSADCTQCTASLIPLARFSSPRPRISTSRPRIFTSSVVRKSARINDVSYPAACVPAP